MHFERSLTALFGRIDTHGDPSVLFLPFTQFSKFLGEHLFALMPHTDKSSIGTLSRTSTSNKFAETLYFPLLFRNASVFGGFFFGILATELAVITAINFHFMRTLVNEKSFIRHLIKKIDVMRNNKNRALIVTQKVCNEAFRFNIEMVSGFVQK